MVKLSDVVNRDPKPEPWAEGEKIPWNDPAFSARMLTEHLSQAHDAASRRYEVVDRQIAWIHGHLLGGTPTQVLDLGCGPGLYTSRLAQLGHTCRGIDFGPASVAYAREQADQGGLACTYDLHDLRTAEYGSGYGLVMLIFGEFNVFRTEDARRIVRKAHAALAPGGLLVLEPHTFDAVEEIGRAPSSWYSSPSGLFSETPHLVLMENLWDAEARIAIERYFVVDAATGAVERHASSMQAYTDAAYRTLLEDCGFADVAFYPSLTGAAEGATPGLLAVVAKKEA
jgi:SAM-dependent methyltransferase